MNIIQTPRLTLEPLIESHATKMFEVLTDPAIYEFENEPPGSVECLAQRYRLLDELNSKYWKQGIGSEAVEAMLGELQNKYSVTNFAAVLKSANFRSMALLDRLKFLSATTEQAATFDPQPDELVMLRTAQESANAT